MQKNRPRNEMFSYVDIVSACFFLTVEIFNCVAGFVDEEIKTERYMACLGAKIGVEKCAEILKPACKEGK